MLLPKVPLMILLLIGLEGKGGECGEVNGTESDENVRSVKIRKCCPVGSVLHLDVTAPAQHSCRNVTSGSGQEEWSPFFYNRTGGRSRNSRIRFAKTEKRIRVTYEAQLPRCNSTKLSLFTPNPRAAGPKRVQIRVTPSGEIYSRLSGNHEWNLTERGKVEKAEIQQLCIDGLAEETAQSDEFQRSEENQILLYCLGQKQSKRVSNLWFVHLAMMVVVIVFLSMVVVAHALVWDAQNIHGWTVATYSAAFLAFIVFRSVSDNIKVFRKLSDGEDVASQTGFTTCFIIGVVSHFFSIAKYSWMTIINFDMWSKISKMTKRVAEEERRRFRFYLLFGFGLPTLIISNSLFFEFYFDYFDERVVRPQYGVFRCDVDKSAALYHEIIVNSVLFLVGVAISGVTVKFILDFLKKAHQFRSTSKSSRRYNLVRLFGKIFILLAFSWVFEVVGNVWGFLVQKTIYWHVTLFDIHSWIQSIGFFWFFVCSPEMTQRLSAKYQLINGVFEWFQLKHIYTQPVVSTGASQSSQN